MFYAIYPQSWSDAARARFMNLIRDRKLFAQITDIDQVSSRLKISYILI